MSDETNAGDLIVAPQHPTTAPQGMSVFSNAPAFEMAQRIAKALSSSDLVPANYKGNLPNCLIALEVAQRTGSSPLMVMQHLNVIHGRPSWSSQYIIAAVNSCGRFSPLRFRVDGEGDAQTCIASATDAATGELLEGPPVSIRMAKEEGWWAKSGSKWKTMPDLMLRYRAAAFFGRLYAPDVLMGMHSAEEVADFIDVTPTRERPAAAVADLNADLGAEAATVAARPRAPDPVEDPVPAASAPDPEPAPATEQTPTPANDNTPLPAGRGRRGAAKPAPAAAPAAAETAPAPATAKASGADLF